MAAMQTPFGTDCAWLGYASYLCVALVFSGHASDVLIPTRSNAGVWYLNKDQPVLPQSDTTRKDL
jgi:hypothetical protein